MYALRSKTTPSRSRGKGNHSGQKVLKFLGPRDSENAAERGLGHDFHHVTEGNRRPGDAPVQVRLPISVVFPLQLCLLNYCRGLRFQGGALDQSPEQIQVKRLLPHSIKQHAEISPEENRDA